MTWAADRFGVRLVDDGAAEPLDGLVAVGLRRNPRRAHLLVSSVLGKHIPVAPDVVLGAGRRLGGRVAAALDGSQAALVLGYAETATALGHCVASALGAPYLHSTRRPVPGSIATVGFEEEHSHATDHLLLPDDSELLLGDGPVVLVDDEVSTGRTALNTIAALQRLRRRRHYVLACLVDVRTADDCTDFELAQAALGTHIDVVALGRGQLNRPEAFPAAATEFAARVRDPAAVGDLSSPFPVSVAAWPAGVRDGGRHGFAPDDDRAAQSAAVDCAAALAPAITGDDVLVLGFEELMYAPLLVADALHSVLGAARRVRFSSTTRSPVVVVDEPGYPIRTAVRFDALDAPDDPAPRFAYNVAPPAGARGFTDVVVVVDDVADTTVLHAPDGLLAQVAATCERVHLLVVPSYRPQLVEVVTA